jgi:hypothetical protein
MEVLNECKDDRAQRTLGPPPYATLTVKALRTPLTRPVTVHEVTPKSTA